MKSFKGWISIILFLSSLIFLGIDHRGNMLGDYIFEWIGISPWSDSESNLGEHYSSILGIIMLIFSGSLIIDQLRKLKYKYVGRTIIIFGMLYFYVYPFLTEQWYYLANRNNTGIEAVDFLRNDSRCTYRTNKDILSLQCSMRIVNYGRQSESIEVRPIVQESGYMKSVWSLADIQHQAIILSPRSNRVYSMNFESNPDHRLASYGASGTTNSFDLEILKDGQLKEMFK